MAYASERYRAGMQNFCQENFGTSDLDACRTAMRNEYKQPW